MKLILFFTRGMSLRTWDRIGMLSREVALYQQLQRRGVDVTFVTYGDQADLRYSEQLPGMHICCNRWRFSKRRYEALMPWLHWNRLYRADLMKTNQMNGADTALRLARRYGKPLISRCGYMWSKNVSLEKGRDSTSAARTLAVEKEVFSAANRIVVTTFEMVQSIHDRFPELAGKISVIPNYVDTVLFQPRKNLEPLRPRLCFVGRLAPEKNLAALMQAVQELDVDLDIIGDGPLRESLEKQAGAQPRISFLGQVPNDQLPGYFHNSTAFVFPSLYEGHPKTPIEAMACGLPVIATDVSGVREVIRHGETGWLCQTDARSLRQGILTVLSDSALRRRLGEQARSFVVEHYSLDKIVDREIWVYESVLAMNKDEG